MKKLIATDYDGTFRRLGVIDPEDVRRVRKWRAAGRYFGFVTGRGEDFIQNFKRYELAQAGVTADFLILYNGALVTDLEGNVWEETFIDRQTALELSRFFAEQPNMQSQGHVADADRQRVYYATAASVEEALRISEIAKREFGDRVNPEVNGWHINCMAAGTGKSSGIACVLKHFGLKKKEAAVVGDDWNDVSMVKEYDGWIMSTASQPVKAQAPHLANSIGDLADLLLGGTQDG